MSHHFTLKTNYKLAWCVGILCAISLVIEVFEFFLSPISLQPGFFLVAMTLLSILLLLGIKRSFTPFFLLSSFTVIATWRLAALVHYQLIVWVLTLAMLIKLCNYFLFAYESVTSSQKRSAHHHQTSLFEWQLLFIRLFIGFDLIPHFCEKLLAGPIIRAEDVHAFAKLGVADPLFMVIIAGLIELGGALSLSCGFLTRLGSIGLAIYMLTATVLGHHFSKGFIWASPGGGWEYPVLWTVLILSFAVFGAGDFSIDRVLKDQFSLPTWLRHVMGGRHE